MVALKGACRNYDALWYCLARCRDVGSDYNIFFFCSVLFCSRRNGPSNSHARVVPVELVHVFVHCVGCLGSILCWLVSWVATLVMS